jgi:integrase
MASVQKRKNRNGSTSFIAWVRIRPFKPTARAFPDRKAALAWADGLERELRKQRDQGSAVTENVTRLTVAQLIRQFLDDPATKALRYFSDLELLLLWWTAEHGSDRVLRFNVLKLREARERLHKGRAAGTTNRYLSAMRATWNWGRASGLVPQDLLWPSRLMLPEPKGRTRYLSDGELAALLKAAAQQSPVLYAAIVVSLATGVRQGELLRLKWGDVDLDGGSIRVLETKNATPRSVHLPSAAVEALRVLKRAPVVGQHVFTTAEGQPFAKMTLRPLWTATRTAAKLADFRWHDLRHSCASYLAQNGATLLEIGSVLGHKSPSMTQRYAHLVAGQAVTGHAALNAKLAGAKNDARP